MQTQFPAQDTFLPSFRARPKKTSSYSTEILLAAGAALFWMFALPLASLVLIAAGLGRRLGELTRRIARPVGN